MLLFYPSQCKKAIRVYQWKTQHAGADVAQIFNYLSQTWRKNRFGKYMILEKEWSKYFILLKLRGGGAYKNGNLTLMYAQMISCRHYFSISTTRKTLLK